MICIFLFITISYNVIRKEDKKIDNELKIIYPFIILLSDSQIWLIWVATYFGSKLLLVFHPKIEKLVDELNKRFKLTKKLIIVQFTSILLAIFIIHQIYNEKNYGQNIMDGKFVL